MGSLCKRMLCMLRRDCLRQACGPWVFDIGAIVPDVTVVPVYGLVCCVLQDSFSATATISLLPYYIASGVAACSLPLRALASRVSAPQPPTVSSRPQSPTSPSTCGERAWAESLTQYCVRYDFCNASDTKAARVHSPLAMNFVTVVPHSVNSQRVCVSYFREIDLHGKASLSSQPPARDSHKQPVERQSRQQSTLTNTPS